HECLDRLAKRCEPFAFVHDLSKLASQFLLGFHGVAVKDQFLKLLVSRHEDGSSRSLVNAAGLHAYYTVFHDIDDADAVFSAQAVQFGDDLGYFHGFAVQGLRNACLESHSDLSLLVGSLLRSYAENQHIVIVGSLRGILKFQALVADMPQVAVTAVAVTGVKGKID